MESESDLEEEEPFSINRQVSEGESYAEESEFSQTSSIGTISNNVLLEMNIDELPKDKILDTLLNYNHIEKTITPKKPIYKGKLGNSTVNNPVNKGKKLNSESKFIFPKAGNAEFVADFNTAVKKTLQKLSTKQRNILNLLVKDESKLKTELNKLKLIGRERIESKVTEALERKQEKVENLREEEEMKFEDKHPFMPDLGLTEKRTDVQRTVSEYVADQEEKHKKLQEKKVWL